MSTSEFKPKIVGFLCNWCSYAGADLAGVSRIQYSPTIRIVRVMCSGRIDPLFILKAFRSGADGVLVAGCHPGDCHYISGNYKTENRIILLRKVIAQFGINPERLRLDWISASEGDRFAQIVNEMTDVIKKLGPNPLKHLDLFNIDKEKVDNTDRKIVTQVPHLRHYRSMKLSKKRK